jgi:hypothetical protein
MAKRQNKLEIVEEFIDIAYEQIKARYSEDAGIKNVLMFLIERGLVDPISLRDFMVLNDFHKILKDNEGHITYTFMDLSIKYDISDRTAQNIVYKKRKKFRTKSNIR